MIDKLGHIHNREWIITIHGLGMGHMPIYDRGMKHIHDRGMSHIHERRMRNILSRGMGHRGPFIIEECVMFMIEE